MLESIVEMLRNQVVAADYRRNWEREDGRWAGRVGLHCTPSGTCWPGERAQLMAGLAEGNLATRRELRKVSLPLYIQPQTEPICSGGCQSLAYTAPIVECGMFIHA